MSKVIPPASDQQPRPGQDDPHPPAQTGGVPVELLPPVTPPSAGFLMQLFVIPLVIVLIIVLVMLLFNRLAAVGSRPEELVESLRKLNLNSWQQAVTLASQLTNSDNKKLLRDRGLAGQLAQILHEELAAGSLEEERVSLRVYLCQALGAFELDVGLPELIAAAQRERDHREWPVRVAALQSLSRLIGSLGSVSLRDNASLLEAIRSAALERETGPEDRIARGQLREAAAFALGVLGGDAAIETLAALASDPFPGVRYNAATGLARHGDARAVPGLLEMLQPDNREAVRIEIEQEVQEAVRERRAEPELSFDDPRYVPKRQVVIHSALQATEQLLARNPQAPRSELVGAIRRLREDPHLDRTLIQGVRVPAAELLRKLGA